MVTLNLASATFGDELAWKTLGVAMDWANRVSHAGTGAA
jgi:hypothetical protein